MLSATPASALSSLSSSFLF